MPTASTPATPASPDAIAKVRMMIRSLRMPRVFEITMLSAVARMAMPTRVSVTNRCSASISPSETARMTSWTDVSVTPPRCQIIRLSICTGKPTCSPPKKRVANSCSTRPAPLVRDHRREEMTLAGPDRLDRNEIDRHTDRAAETAAAEIAAATPPPVSSTTCRPIKAPIMNPRHAPDAPDAAHRCRR